MPNYDFLNLSPTEFEELTRDVLQQFFNITLETFTNGRDQGVDLRNACIPDRNLIVQCKRYKNFDNLIANLKKEVTKVQILKPTRYIIATTVGLTPGQKEIITSLFTPYIHSPSDIFSKGDINNLLNIYSKIEKQHFKLWLSSTNILDKILNSKIYNQSNFEENTIKETINLYVDNESYYKAVSIIKEKKYVIISGIPGIGKTTLARILACHYLANGFEEFIYLSDSINDGYSFYKEGQKQIFFFDDFLGTNFLENKLNTNEEQRIVKFIERISKSKDKILILTTREYILEQAKQRYDSLNAQAIEIGKCIIDLSHYTKIVKAKILYNHLYFSELPEEYIEDLLNTETYKVIIQHPNYSPRIIQTITNEDIWKSINPQDFSKKFLEFIKNPTSVWKHAYENQISKLSQCILANLMSAGTPIFLADLKTIIQCFAKRYSLKYGITYNEIDFKKSIRELENTFIKINKAPQNQLVVEYQNPSVQDFLVFYFRDLPDFVTDILKPAAYFNQLFKVFSFQEDFDFAVDNRILLGNEQINTVVDLLLTDFDFLNSTEIRRHSSSYEKEICSDYTKIDQIARVLQIEKYPLLKQFLIDRFKQIMFPKEFHLQHEEIKAYVNLIEEFQSDMEYDASKVIRHLSESIIDSNDFEEFEKLERIFGDIYLQETSNDYRHKQRIMALLRIETEQADDDSLEDILAEIITRAKKYKIDYSDYENAIEERINAKRNDEKDPFDWDSVTGRNKSNEIDGDNLFIKNLFDSLRTEKKNLE